MTTPRYLATSILAAGRIVFLFLTFNLAFFFSLSAAADFNRAVQNFAAERYLPAMEEFSQLAALGHTGSQFNLGAMHFLGQGVPQNAIEAYAWIALAAEDNDATASALRDRLWNRFDQNERAQAQLRFEELQEKFGKDVLQKNLWPIASEVQLEEKPDEANSIDNRAPEYPKRALNLRLEGAVDIEYSLDRNGYVTDFFIIDSTQKIFNAPTLEAIQYWRFAPRLIDDEPIDVVAQLQRIHFRLESAKQPEGTANYLQEQALRKLRRHAEAGEPIDMFTYAYTGILEHEGALAASEANTWYLKAAQAGLADAQFQLGRNLAYGIGCERDVEKARRWLTLAAEAGLANAQYFLALMLLNDEPEVAMAWLDRAAIAQLPVAIVKKAWLLATHRDDKWLQGEEALKLIKRQLKHYPDTLTAQRTLAASLAASGNFEAAVAAQQQVIKLAEKFSRPIEIEEQRLAAYQEKRIWRE